MLVLFIKKEFKKNKKKMIKSLDWDLRMRVINDIIACYILKYTFPCYSQDLRVILWYLNLPLFQVKNLRRQLQNLQEKIIEQLSW